MGQTESELEQAIKYAKGHNLASGYTSVLYKTPNEDIGFWYNNLCQLVVILDSLNFENTTELEKSNTLIRVRESLVESGSKGESSIIVPSGISRYPHNLFYEIWGLSGYIALILGTISLFIFLENL